MEHCHHSNHRSHNHQNMVADFRKRFWISICLTVPILALSPMIPHLFGVQQFLTFPGNGYVLFALSSVIFFYGGWPFLKGLHTELFAFNPGMMTLIAIAITVAYVYSAFVVLGVKGEIFFAELATLIDIMLLGHWIEMRSILGASKALQELVKLMPSEAHKIMPGGDIKNVPIEQLQKIFLLSHPV